MMVALAASVFSPPAWRESLLLVGWLLVAGRFLSMARLATGGSDQRHALWAFAGMWGTASLQQGVLVAQHAAVLPWASVDVDMPLLLVGGAYFAVAVFFAVRSSRPGTSQ